MSNVTPIRPTNGPQPPEKPPSKPRRRRREAPRTLLLDDSDSPDLVGVGDLGYTTRDVIRGLYGVSLALDEHPGNDANQWLASAARVLSAILHGRAEES